MIQTECDYHILYLKENTGFNALITITSNNNYKFYLLTFYLKALYIE